MINNSYHIKINHPIQYYPPTAKAIQNFISIKLNCILNLIPYKNPWIGFIHHTFDESFSDYNCNNLFNSLDFVESLKTCKGLFVLSKYLKKQFDERLTEMGIDNVKVFALVHPTEIDVKQFQYKKFFDISITQDITRF